MKTVFVTALFFLLHMVQAQPKYWIYFKDKCGGGAPPVSAQTLLNRGRLGLPAGQDSDLPICPAYHDGLARHGVRVVNQSRWLNAVSARLTGPQRQALAGLDYIREISPLVPSIYVVSAYDPRAVANSAVLDQLNADALRNAGLTGKGVTIGIIDIGFLKADANPSLRHIFDNKRLLGSWDFVSPADKNVFLNYESQADGHGTQVWQHIAGIDTVRKTQYGLATEASFYLARTDHGGYEFRGEEDYWIAALERMDSLGVRLVNSSVGYSTDFDDARENHAPADMDGKTTAIARAAQVAVAEKGMLLVVAAGNEGENKEWLVLSSPSDAEGVLAVGAGNKEGGKQNYSSIGPGTLPYLKPNVVCFSATGTSDAAPVITGLVACLMQKYPHLTNREIVAVIERSANLYPYGNNYVGYGVPDAGKILALLEKKASPAKASEEIKAAGNETVIRTAPLPVQSVTVFHKSDRRTVRTQQLVPVKRDKITVRRPAGAVRSTVSLPGRAVEIVWQQP